MIDSRVRYAIYMITDAFGAARGEEIFSQETIEFGINTAPKLAIKSLELIDIAERGGVNAEKSTI